MFGEVWTRDTRVAERRCVMKSIAFGLLVILTSAGLALAQAAPKKTPSKYFVDIEGHIAPVSTANLEATLTFSHDVHVPGATLPAGTYLFVMTSPNTMRITSEDRSKVYAMFLTLPASRPASNIKHAQVRFERMPDGSTRLIGLYPDGSSSGYAPTFKTTRQLPGAPIATSGTKP